MKKTILSTICFAMFCISFLANNSLAAPDGQIQFSQKLSFKVSTKESKYLPKSLRRPVSVKNNESNTKKVTFSDGSIALIFSGNPLWAPL